MLLKAKRYSAYKDSGIEWVGQIPEHWHAIRLKFLLERNDGGVWGEDLDGIEKNATKVFRSTEINIDGSWDLTEEPEMRILSTKEKLKALLKEGDLLVTKSSGSQLHIGKTALVNKEIENLECCYSNFMQRIRPLNKEIAKYLYIFLNSQLSRIQYNYLSNSSTGLANLSADIIGEIIIPTPPPKEQQSITSYLDRKTAQMDNLIAKKERLIELLKEERTAIINQAVTKGLDPKVELKDSGIEWLDKVPKHWTLKKLKYVSRVNSVALTETTDEDYEFCYIDISNVDLEDGFNVGEKISFRNAPSRARRVVQKGDTIVSTVRTYLKAITYFEDEVKDIVVSTGFAVVKPQNNFIPKFLYYVLRSEKFIDRVCALSVGVSYPAINSIDLSDITIWYPDDKEEQKEIIEYLDSIVLKTKIVAKRLQAEIEYLKEFRTALISEVVTGKIDVRGNA